MKLSIPISVPPLVLRPNGSRGNPFVLRDARRKQREETKTAALVVLNGRPAPQWARARYRIIAHTARQWDEDALVGSLKGALDALQDVGIVVNDRHLKLAGSEWNKPHGTPFIILEVTNA